MKKFLAVAMVCLLALTFASCGQKDEEKTGDITSDEISELYAKPDEFKDRTFEFTAKVFDVESIDDAINIQAWEDYENESNDTLIYYDGDTDIKAGDYIKVEGVVEGAYESEDQDGKSMDVPYIKATKVEKISEKDAVKIEKTVKVDKTITQGEYEVTLEKVEFTADNQARIYLDIENNSQSDFEVFPDQGYITQGDQKYDMSSNADYDGIINTLKGGADADEVIPFDNVEQKSFTYTFTGYDNDHQEVTFKFDVEI